MNFSIFDSRRSRTLSLVVLLFAVGFGAPQTLRGQETIETNLDYRVQGEYQGRVRDFQGYTGRLGMNVIALGDGKFDAVVFRGGLPADGWDLSTRWQFSGGQTNGAIVLQQKDGQAQLSFVDDGNGFWYLKDATGRLVAGLINVTRQSPTMGRQPPQNATVKFDGETILGLVDAKVNENGTLGVGFLTEQPVQDFELHLEFRTPFEPDKRGQGRGNSGVYIQRRYEVQVLDSFGLPGEINECAALYKQRRPDLNMCFPPLVWQTYDIQFSAARFNEAGEKISPARITVKHNGRAVHDNVAIKTKTGAGQPESPEPLPILFQDHSNPVEYRNLWLVPR